MNVIIKLGYKQNEKYKHFCTRIKTIKYFFVLKKPRVSQITPVYGM